MPWDWRPGARVSTCCSDPSLGPLDACPPLGATGRAFLLTRSLLELEWPNQSKASRTLGLSPVLSTTLATSTVSRSHLVFGGHLHYQLSRAFQTARQRVEPQRLLVVEY